MKAKMQLVIGIVSLVALLAYTLAHTGALLAQYVSYGLIGYVAAFGIELSIVSLSLRIGELRKTRQSAGFFYFVLVSVVIVSAVANVAEGFHVAYKERLTLSSVGKLDFLQAAIGVTATGLISLIVLALSEIFGTDVSHTVKAMERQNRDKWSNVPDSVSTLGQANDAKQAAIVQRRDKVLELMGQGQQPGDIAAALDVSIKTIRRDIEALNGRAGGHNERPNV